MKQSTRPTSGGRLLSDGATAIINATAHTRPTPKYSKKNENGSNNQSLNK
jgi:hypothetical protein